MNGSDYHKYMRVGIVQFMLYPALISGDGPLVETAGALVSDPFLDVIEIGPVNDPITLARLHSLLHSARVEAVYDGQPWTLMPGLDLGSEDPKARAAATTAMKRAIDQAAALESSTCGCMSGRLTPGLNVHRAMELLIDSLKELCEYAKPKNITLCLENFDQLPYSKDSLIGPTSEAVKLSESVRKEYSNFGLLLDLSHLPIMGETPETAVATASDHLVRTQIGNCSTNPYSAYYGDVHPYIGAPRTDIRVEDLAKFLRALLQCGFIGAGARGIVSFEVKPLPTENPQAILAGCRRTLAAAWALVECDLKTSSPK